MRASFELCWEWYAGQQPERQPCLATACVHSNRSSARLHRLAQLQTAMSSSQTTDNMRTAPRSQGVGDSLSTRKASSVPMKGCRHWKAATCRHNKGGVASRALGEAQRLQRHMPGIRHVTARSCRQRDRH